jgi:DNA-binding SARP family transcriptional activator/tetratricopeptide (TPR) repeat protein
MDFRILGPLEASRDGVPLASMGPKPRALLALLLVHANELVPQSSLVDGLWGERPPETAAKALQVYVSQLRRLLGHERVLTRPGGYQLVVSTGALDLLHFQRLVAEARESVPVAAAPKLREALALWRGQALADVAEAPFAQMETGRLEELRLAAAEQLVDAELALGQDGTLVPELERSVARNPLRERPRAQLMLAFYRSGRQAEALECYQEGRRGLVDELGIEPGRQLRDLHQAILRQDAALDADPEVEVEEQPHEDVSKPLPPPTLVAREERKTVTAVCVALATLSERGEALDPEALRRVTSRAFGEVEAAVELHGGTVETVAVDAISAIFGVPVLHEDDALRAARGAAELRQRLASLATEIEGEQGARLGFCVGLSTGEVVTGGDAASQMRATGVPLAVSSRLAQVGQPGEILVDESTVRLARDAMVVEPVDVGSGPAFRLVSVMADLPRQGSRLTSPMVGRERERRRLLDAFEQAVGDRSCQLFTVLGAAGVGKSRLIREFLGSLAGRALVIRGRCLPYGEGITFWPLLEAVREAAGLDDADSPEAARTKLIEVIGDEPGADVRAQRVAEMIGLADGPAEDGVAAVLSLFQALARTHPLVVVFDDIHWGEATFLDLIEHVADWARGAPILLVCLARPELLDARSGWGGGKLNATSALLEALSDEECALLIENLVGQTELAEEVGDKIAAAAEGNPLFVEEMLSMLIDEGVLVGQNGRWIAVGDMPAIRVPPTIQALLAARLDRLDPDERAVIERAAVQGKVLYEEAVADSATKEPSVRVADSLGSLVRKDLIRPDRASLGGRTYRFRHLLIRDAAYESIPKKGRAETHEHFARWLERAAGERATEHEEIVGYHLEQAYRYTAELGEVDEAASALARSAAERLGAAGRRAFARSDAPAALNLISRAVSLLPPEDPLRVDLIPSVRVVQGMGDLTWADKVLTEAVEAAATSGDRSLAAQALVQRGLLRLFTAPDVTAPEFLQVSAQAIRVFEELGDDLGLARAWRLVGQAHYLGRRGRLSADANERALGFARRAGNRFEEREIVEWLGIAFILGSTPAAEGERRCRKLLEEVTGESELEVHLLGTLAFLVAIQGRTEEFHELMARAEQTVTSAEEWIWVVPAHFAWLALLDTDPGTVEQNLRPDYEALKRIGEKSHFSSYATLLAQAVYAQGRYEEAEQFSQEAAQAARPNDVHSQIIWRSTRAKVLARRGEREAAESLAREAVGLAEAGDFLQPHAEAFMDLAEVLELSGRGEEAAEAVRRAITLYEAKGNLTAAELAHARLERLSS